VGRHEISCRRVLPNEKLKIACIGCHAKGAPFWSLDLGSATSVEVVSSPVNEQTAPKWSIVTNQFPARGGMPPVEVVAHDSGNKPPRPASFGSVRQMSMSILLLAPVLLPLDAYGAANHAIPEGTRDGSRAPAVHRIALYDVDGEKIGVDDEQVLPFSTRSTCGRCHDYETIASGWHFNAAAGSAPVGRPGEPWILTDAATGTQLPVSNRGWNGAWRPADVGLSPWRLVNAFGSHMPGGGVGEMEADPPDITARWFLSGPLEINCLGCHSNFPQQDHSEWARQIAFDNLSWAATAASGVGAVSGAVLGLPDTYDPYSGPDPDNPNLTPPSVELRRSFFDSTNKVFFDIAAKARVERCYACHSTVQAGPGAPELWETDEDVHLLSGLTCVDCHRNGLDHQIVRGYAGEADGRGKQSIGTLSCAGCHLGDESADGLAKPAGRLGAPRPNHENVLESHLETMACTACHSGPWPGAEAGLVRTSRAHKLGVHTVQNQQQAGLPYIVSPVFMRTEGGKIAPHNVLWPSFWGRMQGDSATPLLPETVNEIAGETLRPADADSTQTVLDESTVVKVLQSIAAAGEGTPVYVSNGKLYQLGADGALAAGDHSAAQPYAWPVAHEVRPPGYALGAGGCTDCHAEGSGFFFGKVSARGPAQIGDVPVKAMHEFEDVDMESLQATF